VAQVFRRLYGPVLASPQLVTRGADKQVDTTRVRERIPAELPDL